MTFEEWWGRTGLQLDCVAKMPENPVHVAHAAWQAAKDQMSLAAREKSGQLAQQPDRQAQAEGWEAVWGAIVDVDRDFVLRASGDGLTGLQIAEKFIRERCAQVERAKSALQATKDWSEQ